MIFITHSREKLQLFGQDAVGLLIHEFLKSGILDEFSHALANMDCKEEYKREINFALDFNKETHHDQLLYHLVTYGATLLKYNAHEYIKDKMFFGGYKPAPYKAFEFSRGLEEGLNEFKKKGKLVSIKSIIVNSTGENYSYSNGETLDKSPIPYFWFEHTNKSLEELTIEFGVNIASIRQPKNPKIVSVFYEKAKELIPLAHSILTHFFVESSSLNVKR